jgi:Flp pilus assembly protein TadG
MSSRSQFANKSRSGQAGLFVVLNLTLVFGALGFAVDIGFAYYTRQSEQAAADSAALAAAAYASASGAPACGTGGVVCNSAATGCSTSPPNPPTTDLEAGCLYAKANGFVNNGTTQIVSLSANTTAPPGVTGNTPSYWIQANVTTKPYTLFGSFGGVSRLTINASAIAAVSYYNAGACIYVLDPTSSQAFSATGSSTTTATCGIFVNSSSASAFYESGSPTVTASQILVNGGTSVSSSSSVSPTPTTNAGPQADPLATLAMPTFSNNGCTYTNYTLAGSSTATLGPGTYCGGVNISHSATATFSPGAGQIIINDGLAIVGSSTATFNPGTYIINGSSGGVAMQFSNGVTVSGTGVTFFITGQYSGHTIGAVTSTGNAVVNLSAPTSGLYDGMLILQDRNLSYATSNSLANSTASVLQGTLYFPTTSLAYSGASSTGTYTAIIAKKISLTGSAAFKNDPTGMYTGLGSTVRGLIQ